jgi:hypothetical protein
MSARTFLQLPSMVTLHPCQAQFLDGTLDCRDAQHLLFENVNGFIGVAISNVKSTSPTKIFIFWNELFAHLFTFEVWGHAPATQSFCILFKDGFSNLDSCQGVFNCLAAEVNNDLSLSFYVSLAFAKVSETITKRSSKQKVILKKGTIFDPATLLSLNQDTIKAIIDFCNSIILEEVT